MIWYRFEKAKAPAVSFFFFSIDFDAVLYADLTSLLQLMLDLFCTVNIQGRELYLGGHTKYTFDIG